jgi:hypothetical protein
VTSGDESDEESLANSDTDAGLKAPCPPSASRSLKGERLLLYTDGVIEGANGAEEEFGQERPGERLTASARRTVAEMADLVSRCRYGLRHRWTILTVVVCDCH